MENPLAEGGALDRESDTVEESIHALQRHGGGGEKIATEKG